MAYGKLNPKYREVKFPRPPLPAVDEIVPLRRPEDLIAEGRQQRNCVASYIGRVAQGGIYIYRVLSPERATLSVVKLEDGCWHLDQLLGAGNRAVGAVTRQLVAAWLARYSIGLQ
jgi:hypothetical protein